MKYRYLVLISILISCSEQKGNPKFEVVKEQVITFKSSPEEIIKIDTYFKKARESGIYSVKYQTYLDSALMIMPDSAYTWQQKAMALYKARNYSVGKPFFGKRSEV